MKFEIVAGGYAEKEERNFNGESCARDACERRPEQRLRGRPVLLDRTSCQCLAQTPPHAMQISGVKSSHSLHAGPTDLTQN
jgi:hypothetical protein